MAATVSSSRAAREAQRQKRLRRGLEAEIAEMWARFERTGVPAPHGAFPAVVALYEHAEAVFLQRRRGDHARGFTYFGKRFGWQVTSFDRLRVIDWNTKKLVISGGIGAV